MATWLTKTPLDYPDLILQKIPGAPCILSLDSEPEI